MPQMRRRISKRELKDWGEDASNNEHYTPRISKRELKGPLDAVDVLAVSRLNLKKRIERDKHPRRRDIMQDTNLKKRIESYAVLVVVV